MSSKIPERLWTPRMHEAAKAFERFHWGERAEEAYRLRIPATGPSPVLWALGPLVEITYATTKGGGELTWWTHTFGNPLPVLLSTKAEGLVIGGGGYGVSRRGIVG